MEGDIYYNGGLREDNLVDPSQDFSLELQHVLLGDYNFPIGECYSSSDIEKLQLKSALFDEDEGFNEDYEEEALQQGIIARPSDSQQHDSSSNFSHEDCDTEMFNCSNPVTMTTASVSEAASWLHASLHDQDQCLPDNHIDNCYGNSVWTNDVPMQLISAQDHMMSPVKLRELSREPSPTPQPIHCQETFYKEQPELSHDQPNNLPSHDELISMPFNKFKHLLDSPSVSAGDKVQAKLIRKKGKNKSAARHCRQRKMAMLEGLEQEVASLQQQRASLARQKALLTAEAKHWKTQCASYNELS